MSNQHDGARCRAVLGFHQRTFQPVSKRIGRHAESIPIPHPPPPHSHRTRGCLRGRLRNMLVPHHLNTHISGLGYHWKLQKKTGENTPAFSGFFRISSRDYVFYTAPKHRSSFPEKMGISVRPPHTFEWREGVVPI